MHTTKNIQQFNLHQLSHNISNSASWHSQYTSAYIFIGNLPYQLNQGDLSIVFSQFGQIVDIRLIRQKQTGKSKGYGFLAYQDQRSTVLAVDNFNGQEVCGRVLRVDHVRKYNPPKEFLNISKQIQDQQKEYRPTGPDGRGWGKYRQHTPEQQLLINKYKQQKQQRNQLIKHQIGQIQ